MATITASSSASMVARASLVRTPKLGLSSSSPVLGKPSKQETPIMSMSGSLMAAAMAAVMSSPAAMALVDDRMSTEGTGLPFGLSNNLLGWILLGVFALIWSFYTVYTSTLDEDEESGLSL
ncbi:hypothetical protein V2J09_020108 [Rumex salicifolius]